MRAQLVATLPGAAEGAGDPTILILATDGGPDTCEDGDDTAGGRLESIAAVETAFSRGIETSLEDKERWRVYLFFYAAALLIGVGYLASRVVAAQAALQAANESLEKRVKERTRELSETLVRLKESESQLVQSEKMAALGELVATASFSRPWNA